MSRCALPYSRKFSGYVLLFFLSDVLFTCGIKQFANHRYVCYLYKCNIIGWYPLTRFFFFVFLTPVLFPVPLTSAALCEHEAAHEWNQ